MPRQLSLCLAQVTVLLSSPACWLRAALVAITALAGTSAGLAQPLDEASAWSALRSGGIVLFRHANAPGFSDPPGFRLDDCSTQRNLDAVGQAQSRQLGERFRMQRVTVGNVMASQWCRAQETASLAFSVKVQTETAFNSFFENSGSEPAQTAAARALLLKWKGPGALVVVTHQVNITALTGIVPSSGEGIVLQGTGGSLKVIGKIPPP